MAKTATVSARIDPMIKRQAEFILSQLGMPSATAIDMFYRQIIAQRGLPFDAKLTFPAPNDISQMTKEELDRELEHSWAQMLGGETVPFEEASEMLRKEFGL